MKNKREREKRPKIDVQKYLVLFTDSEEEQKEKHSAPIVQIKEYTFQEAKEAGDASRSLTNSEVTLVASRDIKGKNLNVEISLEDKITYLKLNLKKISVPDKIHFHRQTGEMIYDDFLQTTLKVEKLWSTLPTGNKVIPYWVRGKSGLINLPIMLRATWLLLG